MGAYFCKRPDPYPEHIVSYGLICSSLTKWYGEPASLAHIIHLDDLSTSFISEVVRWKVSAQRLHGYEYVELVLKMYPRNGGRGPSFRSDVFFKNEINFYENTLPELLRFQNGKTKDTFNGHLKLFLSVRDGKSDSIVFGNEFMQGFRSPKKKLDLEHGKLVLKALAKFHAISLAMKDQNCEQFQMTCKGIEETYYSKKFWSWYQRLWGQICAVAIDAVEKEYPDTKYVELIKKFAVKNRFKDLIKAVSNRETSVILHGDCIASNYMFKYEKEMPTEVKILDFQQCRCASPVLDVCSFLYNNTDLLKHEEELLKLYHAALTSQVEELGSNPGLYSWHVFMSEVKRYSYFAVAVSFENATTTLTHEEIYNKELAFEWLSASEIRNIADVYEVKNLENNQRRDLAKTFVHCVDQRYITGSLLESSMFNFW